MQITRQSTRYLKLQRWLFKLLFLVMLGLLAYLSNLYVYQADWTVNGQNSLNEVSIQLLQTLDDPVELVSYTSNPRIRKSVQELVQRYQRYKPDMSLRFVDPNADPESIRALNISVDGEMIIQYQGRSENLTELSEQKLTNTLHRLIRSRVRKLVFIEGHGERSPVRQANFDLSTFARHLKKQGFTLETLNLARSMRIPENISVLVIAGPQAAFLPGEVRLLIDYVKAGGNLLWLGEPLNIEKNFPMHGLLPLSELLGIEFLDGVVVDPTTERYGITRPDYAIITEYPDHPINQDFSTVTLFPQAAGIERLPAFIDDVRNADETGADIPSNQENDSSTSLNSNFTMLPFLVTVERSWIETSPIRDQVQYSDLLDIRGPVTIGMILTRSLNNGSESSQQDEHEPANEVPGQEQRIIILGDGDFLSNTFLGNAGNLTLGLNIVNWLSHDDHFIAIPTQIKNDIILDLSTEQLSLLGSFFLLAVPGILVISGTLIWFRRRRR